MKNFASDSTIHGISFIWGDNQSKWSRIFWVFLFLTSFCGFAFYTNYAFTKWRFMPDIAMRSQEKYAGDFPKPAITFCPRMFSKIGLTNYRKDIYEKTIKDTTRCMYYAANLVWCYPSLIDNMKSACKSSFKEIDEMNLVEIINKSALSIEEAFNGPGLARMRILTHQGICFTINMQDLKGIFNEDVIHKDFDCYRNEYSSDIDWTVERGYFSDNVTYPRFISSNIPDRYMFNYGANDAENACGTGAFAVFVHLPNEMPTKFHKFIPIKYGSRSAIFIRAKSHRTDDALRAYSPEVRKCYFEGERKLEFFKSYSKAHCELECLGNNTLKSCGCVLFNMPRNKTTRVCRFSEMKCIDEAAKSKTVTASCNCHPPCNSLKYEIDYAPTNILWKVPSYDVTYMEVIYTSDVVEEIESYLTYKIQNFVADVGGLLGLFLGCSLLSIVEVFYFILSALTNSFKKKNLVESQQANVSLDQEITRLKMEMKMELTNLSDKLERSKCSEMLTKIEKLEANFTNISIKLLNLEKNVLIVEEI